MGSFIGPSFDLLHGGFSFYSGKIQGFSSINVIKGVTKRMKKIKRWRLERSPLEQYKKLKNHQSYLVLDLRSLNNCRGLRFETVMLRVEKIYLVGITGTHTHRIFRKRPWATESWSGTIIIPLLHRKNLNPKAYTICALSSGSSCMLQWIELKRERNNIPYLWKRGFGVEDEVLEACGPCSGNPFNSTTLLEYLPFLGIAFGFDGEWASLVLCRIVPYSKTSTNGFIKGRLLGLLHMKTIIFSQR